MDLNGECSVLSMARYDSFMTTARDALIETLKAVKESSLSLSPDRNLNKDGARRGGRIPFDSFMRFKKALPDAMWFFLRDPMQIFQKRLNAEHFFVIE